MFRPQWHVALTAVDALADLPALQGDVIIHQTPHHSIVAPETITAQDLMVRKTAYKDKCCPYSLPGAACTTRVSLIGHHRPRWNASDERSQARFIGMNEGLVIRFSGQPARINKRSGVYWLAAPQFRIRPPRMEHIRYFSRPCSGFGSHVRFDGRHVSATS